MRDLVRVQSTQPATREMVERLQRQDDVVIIKDNRRLENTLIVSFSVLAGIILIGSFFFWMVQELLKVSEKASERSHQLAMAALDVVKEQASKPATVLVESSMTSGEVASIAVLLGVGVVLVLWGIGKAK